MTYNLSNNVQVYFVTVRSVRSNEASFYIMDYEESNEESYDKK